MGTTKQQAFDLQSFLTKVNGGRTVNTYAANQSIYWQGDLADSVFYIQTGSVKLTVTSEDGKEAIVALLNDAEFFGESCVISVTRRLATATALTESAITRVPKEEINRLIQDYPDFAAFFVSHLVVRSSRYRADLVDQLFNSTEKRLARALLLLANFGEDGKPKPLLAKITQEELAELIGTTRPRVNFFMNKFRRLGLIDYNGNIFVHNSLMKMLLDEKPVIESSVERPEKPPHY